MKDLLHRLAEELGLDENAENLLYGYAELIKEENKKYNLTAITDDEGIVEKHFRDSLFLVDLIPEGAELADVGSGAGLPAIPIAIARPDVEATAIESVGKKCNFLDLVSRELGLGNLNVRYSRIEDYARADGRERFDVVTARAVAPLNTLLEYVAPLVKPGGKALLYKGKNYTEELAAADGAEKILGLELKEIVAYDLKNDEKRYIIVYDKISRTDKRFPRGGNKPRINPVAGGKNGKKVR